MLNSLWRKCSTINVYCVLSAKIRTYHIPSRCLRERLMHRILHTRGDIFGPQAHYDAMNLTIASLGRQTKFKDGCLIRLVTNCVIIMFHVLYKLVFSTDYEIEKNNNCHLIIVIKLLKNYYY